jgi:putative Ca2+/H+ antiporter (TMEM165/GDT1 family)
VVVIDVGLMALTFGTIFLLELPDKTFVATLVLSTRYRPLAVWIGVGLAFGVQCLVAVTAGKAIGYLPEWVVHAVTLVIFCLGAVLLIHSAPSAVAHEQEQEAEYAEQVQGSAERVATARRAVVASFLVIFAAEWGDLSQLFTASLVSRHGHPLSVFVASWAALLVVSGLAALAGRWLVSRMPLSLLHYIGAAVCLGFAVWTGYELVMSI